MYLIKKLNFFLKNDSIIYALSNIFFLGTIFLADVFIVRVYPLNEVGIWKQILLLLQLTIPFFGLGLIEGFRYKISQDKSKLQGYFYYLIVFLLFLSIIILIVFNNSTVVSKISLALGIDTIPNIAPYLFLLFFLLSIEKLLQFMAITKGQVKVILISVLVWSSSFFISILLCLKYSSLKFSDNIFYCFLVAYCLQILTYLNLLKLEFKLKSNFNFHTLYHNNLSFLKFGFPLFLASNIGLLTLNTDKFIINKLGGIEQFAIYSVGALEIPIIALILKSVTTISYPKIVENFAQGNVEIAKQIWLNDLIKISYLTYPVILICIIFSKIIITGIFGAKYVDAVPVFKAYCLILLWRNSAYGTLLSIFKGSIFVSIFSLIAFIVNISLAFFFYKIIGVIGVVYATIVSISVLHFLMLWKEELLKDFLNLYLTKPYYTILTISIFISYFLF